MGMTIDKCILRVEHSSMNVDDKETADFIINIMHKYQKIEDIYYHQRGQALENSLKAVIEDERID